MFCEVLDRVVCFFDCSVFVIQGSGCSLGQLIASVATTKFYCQYALINGEQLLGCFMQIYLVFP